MATTTTEEQRAISNSLKLLTWGTASKSFDDLDIQLTRPGYGVILLLQVTNILQNLRKNCKHLLLMRTRDEYLHVTLFQVSLVFHGDYDPRSLPNNLLETLQNYVQNTIRSDIEKMNANLDSLYVKVTDHWMLLGREYPSHLVIEVHCKEVCHVLKNFKEKVNGIGYEWMTRLAKELQVRKYRAKLEPSEIGCKLSSNGWDLIVGYTANPDYKTHVTLGILPTTDSKLNKLLLQVHGNVDRTIDTKFSSKDGDADMGNAMKHLKHSLESYKMKALKELDDNEISEYSALREQVVNAKTGRPIRSSKALIDEWGRFKIQKMNDTLEKIKFPFKETHINVSKIHTSILNMDRVQNFEPVSN